MALIAVIFVTKQILYYIVALFRSSLSDDFRSRVQIQLVLMKISSAIETFNVLT